MYHERAPLHVSHWHVWRYSQRRPRLYTGAPEYVPSRAYQPFASGRPAPRTKYAPGRSTLSAL